MVVWLDEARAPIQIDPLVLRGRGPRLHISLPPDTRTSNDIAALHLTDTLHDPQP